MLVCILNKYLTRVALLHIFFRNSMDMGCHAWCQKYISHVADVEDLIMILWNRSNVLTRNTHWIQLYIWLFFIVTLEGAITVMVFIFNQTQRRGAITAWNVLAIWLIAICTIVNAETNYYWKILSKHVSYCNACGHAAVADHDSVVRTRSFNVSRKRFRIYWKCWLF